VKEIQHEALLQEIISVSDKKTQRQQTEISKRITGLRFQGLKNLPMLALALVVFGYLV